MTAVLLWMQSTDTFWLKQTLERLDALVYDQRLKMTLSSLEPDPRIVIVDIDERSLQREGRWPWSRDKVAILVERLARQGAAIVVFDVFFPEAERNSADMVLQRLDQAGVATPGLDQILGQQRELFDNNLRFARTLAGHEVILGFHLSRDSRDNTGALPKPLAVINKQQGLQAAVPQANGYISNIALLQSTSGGGFVTLSGDDNIDGTIRRAPMVLRYGNDFYPSLSLEAMRQYLLLDEIGLVTELIDGRATLEAITLGDKRIPTDPRGRVLIPYRGLEGSFPYISATDFLDDELSESIRLNGAIVLIGTTAAGQFDLRATPIQSVYPGVEVHANLIAGILDDTFVAEPSWAVAADFLMVLVMGLFASILMPHLTSLRILLFSLLAGGLLVYSNFWFWSEQQLALRLSTGLLLIILLTLLNMAYGYLFESRGRRMLEDMFGQYVPKELVQAMSEKPESYSFEGETRELTVLFSDIRNFTSVSETLSAADLKLLLNEYFTPMTRIIFETRGTIDKYVGDMLMAFWGAPVEDEQHAINAVRAAMLMQLEAEKLRTDFRLRELPELAIGIGINSGPMSVGDMGSVYRRSYTVLGDAVNLGSRLEGLTKAYRVGIAIGEETEQIVREKILCRELDQVRVKGKLDAVRVFQPVCLKSEADEALLAELSNHDSGLRAYRSRNWDLAEEIFNALHQAHPEIYLYQLYLDRLEELRINPPPNDWDGIIVRQEK